MSIMSAVLTALVIGGCHKDEPPAAPGASAQSGPGIVSLPSHEGQGYVGALLQSRDTAKMAVSKTQLSFIGNAITMYAIEKGGPPASLDDLVKAGSIVAGTLASPGDPGKAARYVYLPVATHKGADILVYDPVAYMGQIPFLVADGSVKSMDVQEFERRLKAVGN